MHAFVKFYGILQRRPVCPGCYPTKLEVYYLQQVSYTARVLAGVYYIHTAMNDVITIGKKEQLFKVQKDSHLMIILVWSGPAMMGNRSIQQSREANSELQK